MCVHSIEWSENLQERLMNEEVARVSNGAGYCRNSVAIMKGGNRLDGVMGGNQEGSELSESLKVGLAVFIEFVGQVI